MKMNKNHTKVHFIGVGGVSMSALAKWAKALNYDVSGSDKVFSKTLEKLRELNIYVYEGSNINYVKSCDIVVYSSAIPCDDSELLTAKKENILTYKRNEFLALLSSNCKNGIAVCGTHGKTTTASLISNIFKNADKKFIAHIGGNSIDLNGNFFMSGNDFIINEACEYKNNFLSLSPNAMVILNIESDHPDCFNSLDELYVSFEKFADKLHNNGFIVVNDMIDYLKLHIKSNVHICTFGTKLNSTYRAKEVYEHSGICTYDILKNGEYFMRVTPNLYGRFNIYNVLGAIALCDIYKIDKNIIKRSLENYKGVERRFEFIKKINGAQIICDYAHHPSEISAVIKTAKQITNGELRVYFQPHTYSRTEKYFNEFLECFDGADELCFLPTFPARETQKDGKSAFDLFYCLNEKRNGVYYFQDFTECAAFMVKKARPLDTCLILGAGDIDKLYELI